MKTDRAQKLAIVFLTICSLTLIFIYWTGTQPMNTRVVYVKSKPLVTQVVVTPTPVPYQSKTYSNLRYDARHICEYSGQIQEIGDVDKTRYWIDKYIKDQQFIENKGLYAPSYLYIAQDVSAPC